MFAHVDGHRLDQSLSFQHGRYAISGAALFLDDGVGVRGQVNPTALHVVLRIDGQRTLAELVDEAADETDLDPDEFRIAAITTVRLLFELGFLTGR